MFEFLLNNTIENYSFFIAFSLGLTVIYVFSKKMLSERRKKSLILSAIFSLKTPVHVFLAFYLGSFFLSIGGLLGVLIHNIAIIILAYQLVISVKDAEEKYLQLRGASDDEDQREMVDTLRNSFSIVLLVLAVIFVLSNLGFNVSALLTGLGIGGIAIAFAAQNILRDLFSYATILIDKPIQKGDEVQVGQFWGKVKKIGIRTTRLQGIGGKEIIISNEKITDASLENLSKSKKRIKKFIIPISAETPAKKLLLLPEKIEHLFINLEKAEFVRAYLKRIDKTSFDMSVSYRVKNRSYQVYSGIHHQLNVLIVDLLKKEKIELAEVIKTSEF